MTDIGAEILTVIVPPEQAGERLDKLLAGSCPSLSRSRIKALIEGDNVALIRDGKVHPVKDAAHKVRNADRYNIIVPPPEDAVPAAQNIPLTIVYEDEHLIIIDKPAGMVVHPAAGNYEGTLVNALIAHCGNSLSGIGGVRRPGIVHRIDKDTSGLMVAAKTDRAHAGLSEQFAAHSLERAYLALTWGAPLPPTGHIEGNIGRSPANRKKMAVVSRGGKTAITHYQVKKRFGPSGSPFAALTECRLETGRTHQIRVHMTYIGHPLVGDPLYGRQNRYTKHVPQELRAILNNFTRQALHAYVIGFGHPITGNFLKFSSPLPSDIKQLVDKLEQFQKTE